MKFRTLILAISLAGAISASAHTHIVINKGDVDESKIAFSDLDRINFLEAGLEFAALESTYVPFSNLSTIHFVTGSSAAMIEEATAFCVIMDSSTLSVKGYSEGQALELISIAGTQMKFIPSYKGQDIDISSLAKGIYIVKQGNNVTKIVKK